MASILNDVALQYGFIGIAVIGLASYIIKIESRHKKERDEWRKMIERQNERTDKMTDENNKVIREHSNILSGLKTLLESRRTNGR